MKAKAWTREAEEQTVALLDQQRRDTEAVREHYRRAGCREAIDEKDLPGDGIDCVYFMAACGRIKIGTSNNVRSRLDGICTPERPVVLALRHGDFKVEREAHRRFAHLRAYLEWFMPGGDLVAYIAEVNKVGPWWKSPTLQRRKPIRTPRDFGYERGQARPPWATVTNCDDEIANKAAYDEWARRQGVDR